MKKYITTALFFGLSSMIIAQSWQTVGGAGFSTGAVNYNTSMAVDNNNNIYIAFQDVGNNKAATVMKFNGTNWSVVGSAGFTSPDIELLSLALDNTGVPYVFYSDAPDGHGTVMKYNGNNWVLVGFAQFTASAAFSPSIAINSAGTPYVAYGDYGNGLKLTVMKFDGNNWVAVGTVGFSASIAQWVSLAIDGNDIPYVAYQDGAPGGVTVQKFNGSNWTIVGNPSFTTTAEYVTIAIGPGNIPYVEYAADAGLSTPTLSKFNGSSWVRVGGNFAGDHFSYYPCLALDASGTPYITFQDNNSTSFHAATCMKFDGTDWVVVGDPGFSGGDITAISSYQSSRSSLSIAIDNNGNPLVAYGDGNQGSKVTVMRYTSNVCNGCVWPGDADYNGVANNYDLLPISVAYGASGPTRSNASLQWMGQPANNWTSSFSNGTNYKHADTNGNGIVDGNDVNAITLNFGLTHSKTQQAFQLNAPYLQPEIVNDTVTAGDTVTILLQLGDSDLPVLDCYGIAFDLTLDAAIFQEGSLQISWNNSWMGAANEILTLDKTDGGNTSLSAAIARNTHTPKSGHGIIATLKAISKSTTGSSAYELKPNAAVITQLKSIDHQGNEILVNAGQDSVIVQNTISQIHETNLSSHVQIFPCPANRYLYIQAEAGQFKEAVLYDMNGKKVAKTCQTILDVAHLQAGMYLCRVKLRDGSSHFQKIAIE